MIPVRIQDAAVADLEVLVGASEEGSTLDFKRDLLGDDRDSRKEFIADVSALANTKGGALVYGIDEDAHGRAGALAPHEFNADAVITALSNALADNLEPRLRGVAMTVGEPA
jgi:predicted HTH transcriptional regulator